MPNVRSLLALLLVASVAGAQKAPNEKKEKHDKKPPKPAALFASDTALRLTIVGDWRALASDRDTLNPVLRPAVLSYVDSGGRAVRIPVKLATRGHYRLKRETCAFPPLRVVFDSGGTKHTVFAGQRALKLATHCNGTPLYEQYVLREHVVYQAHNLLTDQSFRSRLARVRYVDARDTTKVVERWGRFVEAERDLEDRLGGKVVTTRGGLYDQLADSAAFLGLWEYFIGNTDFSVISLHNVRIVAVAGEAIAVPYDFDFSGLVDARYAVPDARLGIPNVRRRLYRGPCLTDGRLAPLLARFSAKRDAIRSLYDALPALDRGYAKDAVAYLDEFYDQARDPVRFGKSLRQSCARGA